MALTRYDYTDLLNIPNAVDIPTSTTLFGNNLGPTDTNVQKALDTLDDMAGGGLSGSANEVITGNWTFTPAVTMSGGVLFLNAEQLASISGEMRLRSGIVGSSVLGLATSDSVMRGKIFADSGNNVGLKTNLGVTVLSSNVTATTLTGNLIVSGSMTSGGNNVLDAGNFVAQTNYEDFLGNPATNGFILSSTIAGVRSWVAPGGGGAEINDLTASVTWANVPEANIPTHTGDVTGQTALTLTSAAITSKAALVTGLAGTDELVVSDAGVIKRMDISVMNAYFNANLAFSNNTGDITAVTVTAGNGLTGGGTASSGGFSTTVDLGLPTAVTNISTNQATANSHTHQVTGFALTAHSHTGAEISALDAADTTTGIFNIARIPTGTSGTTVSFGNHGHSGFALLTGATFTGGISAVTVTATSDIRLKTIFADYPLTGGLDAIYYNMKDGTLFNQYGYSAQEAQQVYPGAVFMNQNGFLSVNYAMIHTDKIQKLENRMLALEEKLNG